MKVDIQRHECSPRSSPTASMRSNRMKLPTIPKLQLLKASQYADFLQSTMTLTVMDEHWGNILRNNGTPEFSLLPNSLATSSMILLSSMNASTRVHVMKTGVVMFGPYLSPSRLYI